MQTKRDYLIGLGLAKPGRGKFSNAAKEALVKAEREGVKFSDVTAKSSTGPVLTKNSGGDKSDQKSDPTQTPYLFPDEYRFPEAEYEAVGDNGKIYSMRDACNTCRVSLVNHACEAPSVYGNVAVRIRERR